MTEDSLIGRQLANFRIERFIGRGGMAAVYYGQDVKLQRPVAIKVIDVRYRGNPTYAERFVREAQAVATWRHEHIVQIFYADDEDGLYYYVMEYVDGHDLGQLMAQRSSGETLMPQAEVLRIGRAFARALDYAHQQGTIHRDVKPSNLMVANDGRVVLTDFGLAMDVEQGSLGEVFGTADYIAPEQARRSANAVPQSDLYSLGVILYELLTGRVPFEDPSPTAVAVQHMTAPPPPPRALNPELTAETEQVLLKALHKTPEARYQSGVDLIDALEAALQAAPSAPAKPATVPAVPPPDDLVGQQLDEYRLEALLGHGGMARVYRGIDVNLDRRVAIKVIDTPHRTDSDYLARFKREAQAIAQLEHPHIVRLYRYGEAGGLLYMAMQYIDGRDLHALLTGYRRERKLIPIANVPPIIRQICVALDYAHGKGVIHRDIKPSNIMLDEQGNAILTDFGLALLTRVGTRGEILGSPHYLAPEQAVSSANVVSQSDFYAVGVILYEMLTGELPFDAGDPLDIAMLHMTEPPVSPRELRPGISPAVEAVLLKSLAKKPDERYATGEELATALEEALRREPVQEDAVGATPTLPRPPAVEEAVDLPPIPAAAAPSTAEPEPIPPSITSVMAEKSSVPIAPEPGPIPQTPSKKGSRFGLLAGIIVLLTILGAAAFLFFRGGQSTSEAEPTHTVLAVATEPEAAEPAATEPAVDEPAATEPAATKPAATEPAATEPVMATEPGVVDEADEIEEPVTPGVQPEPESTSTVAKVATGESLPTVPRTPTPAVSSTEAVAVPTATGPLTPTQIYRLAFTKWHDADGKHSLWLADTDGNNQQFLLDYGASPSWSGDGSYIIFVGEDGITGGSGGIWRMRSSGASRTQLRQDNLARSVTIMPGGATIAYDAKRGDFRVYFVDFLGTVLPIEIPGEQPAWSPDGSGLVIRACRPDCGLWLVNRDGSNPQRLTEDSSDSMPAWSPDGRKIAFGRGTPTNVYVVDVDSGDIEQLTDTFGRDSLPTWTPDSRQIVFRTTRNGRWQIFIMNADGSDQHLIIDNVPVSDDWAFDRMSVAEQESD